MGVPNLLTNWVSVFLKNRQQRVKIGSITSPWLTVNGGVPQGTKLGPLLFLVMINDLQPASPTVKFMDDTSTYEIKPVIGPGMLQSGLDTVDSWTDKNYMNLNAKKTNTCP